VAEHDRSDVWGEVPNVTLVGVRVQVRPDGVEADTERLTVPVKPFSEVRVIVEVPESPGNIWVGLTGPAEMVKSGVTGVVKMNVMSAVV
jgi:hypothetical protein